MKEEILNAYNEFKKSKSPSIKNKIARILLFNNARTYDVLDKTEINKLQNFLKNNY